MRREHLINRRPLGDVPLSTTGAGIPFTEWEVFDYTVPFGSKTEILGTRLLCPDAGLPNIPGDNPHWLGEANLKVANQGCPRCLLAEANRKLNMPSRMKRGSQDEYNSDEYNSKLEYISCNCHEGLWRCIIHAPPGRFLPQVGAEDPRVASMLVSEEQFRIHLLAMASKLAVA